MRIFNIKSIISLSYLSQLAFAWNKGAYAESQNTTNSLRLAEPDNIQLGKGNMAYPVFLDLDEVGSQLKQGTAHTTPEWWNIIRTQKAEAKIDIEKYFEPGLFEEGINSVVIGEDYSAQKIASMRAGAPSPSSFYTYKVTHSVLKMNIKFEGFTQDEIRKVTPDIDKAIEVFDRTIGIFHSEMEYHCTLQKWDQPQGHVLGRYHPQGIDPTNSKIMRCKMEAVIGSATEYEGSTIRHEIAHSLQFFNTNGKGMRTLLCEGIAVFIEDYDNSQPYYIDSTSNLFKSNKALQLYNKDQVLENVRARYQMGPAIIKQVYEVSPAAIRNTLDCIRTQPEEACINQHFKPAFDLTRFKQWLNNNGKTSDAVEESPLVFICDANKSQYKIFACSPWLISQAEQDIANPKEMYDTITGGFPWLSHYVPADSSTILYDGSYKLSYHPAGGASFTEFHSTGKSTTYNCPSSWSSWLLTNIQSIHDSINNAADCHSIQSTSQYIIDSMRQACTQGDIITSDNPTAPITSSSHINTLLLQCDTVKAHCIVVDCNAPKDYNARAQCQRQSQSINHNNKDGKHVDVTIFTDNKPGVLFQCTDGWAEWVIKETEQDKVNIQIATKHIPLGCSSTIPTYSGPSANQPELGGNDTDTASIVLRIVGITGGLTVTTLGAIAGILLYKKYFLAHKKSPADLEQAIPKPEISNPKFGSSTNPSLDQYPIIKVEYNHIPEQAKARPTVPPKPKIPASLLEKASKSLLSSDIELQDSMLVSSSTLSENQYEPINHPLLYAPIHSGHQYIASLTPAANMQPLLGVDSD